MWYLDLDGNGEWDGCSIDGCLGPFGMGGDLPITGNWDEVGGDEIGVFRPSQQKWYLDYDGSGRWGGSDTDRCFGPFGHSNDRPVLGE